MKKKILITSVVLIGLLILVIGSIWLKKPTSMVDQIMNADKGFKFPPGFPPDPGEAGKKTLEGIDSDHDGLRDDLQRWIYARFPNDPKKRAALRQMAVSYQKTLFLKHEPKEMEDEIRSSYKAIHCLRAVFLEGVEATVEREYIQAKVLNTKERTERYLEVDRWFDGMTMEMPEFNGSECEY